MAEITKEQVRELAKLARLGLTKEEEESLSREMTSILNYFNELSDVDTSRIEPTNQVSGQRNVLRVDEVIECSISRDELLANVPLKENGYIKVKKVLE